MQWFKITSLLLKRIKENDPTLTQLDLSQNDMGGRTTIELADALNANHTIVQLDLSFTKLGDAEAKSLSECLLENQTITHLDMSNNKIGDQGAQSISKLLEKTHSVIQLGLRFNEIGDEGAKSLSTALAHIKHLDLRVNQIGNAGIEAIANALQNNHSITFVDVRDNNIEDKGIESLAKALEKNQFITELHLGGNMIGDSGATALSSALKQNHFITHLNLSYNAIGEEGAHSLSQALHVTLAGFSFVSSIHVLEFNPFASLTLFFFSFVPHILRPISISTSIRISIFHPQHNRTLQSLDLRQNRITKFPLDWCVNNSSLCNLFLFGNPIRSPPKHVCDADGLGDPKALKNYISDLRSGDEEANHVNSSPILSSSRHTLNGLSCSRLQFFDFTDQSRLIVSIYFNFFKPVFNLLKRFDQYLAIE